MDRDVIKDMKKLEVYLNMVYCDGRKWMEKIFWSRRSTKKLCFLKNKIAKKKIKENFSTKWITIFFAYIFFPFSNAFVSVQLKITRKGVIVTFHAQHYRFITNFN